MYFQQFYLTCLSHASYMLGSEGIACVVDPQRDVSIYIDEAQTRGLKIEHIIETHLHADFVSGHVELAAKTGAKIYLGAAADSPFQHVAVNDGDEIRFGRVTLRFLETPGHTVESVSIVVTDLDRGEKPWAVLTGDTLFIGDVGRPDLSRDKTPQQLAAMLYDSLHQKLIPLGDEVEVYPAHGAGSLCGKQMRPERQSTIGKERELNYALRAASKDEFVRLLTAELPDRPEYFAQDAEINRTGAIPLDFLLPMEALTPDQLVERQRAGDVVLDTRPADGLRRGHVPGAVNIPLAGQFAGSAGALLGLDHDLHLGGRRPRGRRGIAHPSGAGRLRTRRRIPGWRHGALGDRAEARGSDHANYGGGVESRTRARSPDRFRLSTSGARPNGIRATSPAHCTSRSTVSQKCWAIWTFQAHRGPLQGRLAQRYRVQPDPARGF